MWMAGTLMIAFAADLLAAHPTYYFLNQDQSEMETKVHPQYIRDADVASTVPGFAKLGARIDACYQSMTIPNQLFITYPPSVVGPHSARTNVLNCVSTKDPTQFACQIAPNREFVVFGNTASRYFVLGPNTNLDEALKIYDAYWDRTLQLDKGLEMMFGQLRIRSISRSGKTFDVVRSDCGCSDTTKIEFHHANGQTVVVAIAYAAGVCT